MIKRLCLFILVYSSLVISAIAQLPFDTGFKVLSPKFFPGWQAQHVSYPFVIYDSVSSQYKMYYAGSSSTQVNESLWDQWVTGVVSSTNTLNWTYPENYEQVLFARKFMEGDVVNPDEQSKIFDAVFAIDACILKEGAVYKCWYTGWNGQIEHIGGGLSKKINFRIGHATSRDGLKWTKLGGSAGAGAVLGIGRDGEKDSHGAEDPYVLKENGIYRMWYVGYDGRIRRIHYATSGDGTHWTKKGVVTSLVDITGAGEQDIQNPVVISRGGKYELWYMSQGASAARNKINRAESPDGISWKKTGEVLLHPASPDPTWPYGPWSSISSEGKGKIVLGNIIVQADNSCQVFYMKQYTARKNVTYGVIQTPLSFIYTERVNP